MTLQNDLELAAALAETTRRLHWAITRGADSGASAEPFRERRGQVRAMHALADGSELTMQELAQKLQVAPPTVTGMIRGLVEQGFVSRVNDEHDWRVVRVCITEAGREALDQHRHDVLQRVGSWVEELKPEERASLIAAIPALKHLSSILEAQRTGKVADHARNS